MNGTLVAAAALAATLACGVPAAAQRPDGARRPDDTVRRQYAAIDGSVVRIRTVADMEYSTVDPNSGLRASVRNPLSVHGTGVVVGEVTVDGNREYLIVTNHHVADVSNYVVPDGRFLRENRHNTRETPSVPEESFVAFSEDGEKSDRDIRLIEVGRNARGDMAVLRTVGARTALPVFGGTIGYREGAVPAGAPVITSGYPNGEAKVVEVGTVVNPHRPHELGQPHVDMTIDLAVERGQSGSPVFMVETEATPDGPRARFTLIGLVHASEGGEKFMVPYSLWKETLAQVEGSQSARLVR